MDSPNPPPSPSQQLAKHVSSAPDETNFIGSYVDQLTGNPFFTAVRFAPAAAYRHVHCYPFACAYDYHRASGLQRLQLQRESARKASSMAPPYCAAECSSTLR